MAEDFDARTAYDVAGGLFVTFGVDQMASAEAQYRAVGEQLVQVNVRVSGWLLSLVLGVDDGEG